MEKIPKPAHGSQEWLEIRHRDSKGNVTFGASEAGALMGVSEYTTLADLCVSKLTDPEVTEPTKAMLKGIYFEDALINFAKQELGLAELVTPEFMYRFGRFTATLDGAVLDSDNNPTLIVECKVTSAYTVASADDLPLSWVMQGHVQHYVTGAPVFFSVFDRRQNLTVVEMPVNSDTVAMLVDQAQRVGTSLDLGVIVPEAWGDVTADHVQRIYQPVEGKAVIADDQLINWIVDLENTNRMIKELEADKKRAQDEIAKAMLDAEVVTDANGVPLLSWKQQNGRVSLDSKALQAAHPEIYAQFEKRGAPFRVMRFGKGNK